MIDGLRSVWIIACMVKRNMIRFVSVLALGVVFARAEVKLPALFSDNMVLQRDKSIAVWGWAENGERVTVKLGNNEAVTVAENGKWKVFLPKMKAGGPHSLTVTGKNQLVRTNVLMGEVWICSGQSNMEWRMSQSFEPTEDIRSSKNNRIRLFTVPKLKANEPVEDVKASWVLCEPSEVTNFSAVAFYFGRTLQRDLGVPVGLIHTSWGGSPAEVWMRHEALEENALYKAEILDPFPDQQKWYDAEVAKWEKEKADLEKEGKKITRGRPWGIWKPSELYNGMIAPLIPLGIRGAIWYQGESNAGRAHQYRSLLPDMITNWRQDFGQGDFPFLLVQLAPWDRNQKRDLAEITKEPMESDWAELREAQLLSTKVLPNVGMAVITDVGDKDDIHPAKKGPVGARLARAARGIAYGEKGTHQGPVYRGVQVDGDKATISFENTGRGLVAKDGELKGFAIAGKDRKFIWAKAVIDGDKVVVSSPEVSQPIAVRFGWADYPVVNLFNKDGLPASPFRTDNFPIVSGPKVVKK
jgi:sialate O-acetylesterase